MALVGMAGLIAGSTHAPLTAILMVFEMTRDYGLILPLMLTSVLAYLVARRLYPESIYTEWLVRRGVVLSHGADAALLAHIRVAECLNREPVTVREDAGLEAVLALMQQSCQTEFPVVSADGRPCPRPCGAWGWRTSTTSPSWTRPPESGCSGS